MVSPCPDIEIQPEVATHGRLFDEVLIATDTDFTSNEDCETIASYFHEVSEVNENISDFPLMLSNLDVIVDNIWKPEDEQGLALMFQAIFNWLKSFGFNIDTTALQEHLPSFEAVRLFTELSAGLILLLVLVFTVRAIYRVGFFSIPRKSQPEHGEFTSDNGSSLPHEPVDGLTLREQIGALLQRSISLLRKHKMVPVSSSYTNHELVDHLDASKSPLAKLFVRQVSISEPVIYGTQSVSQELVKESQQICDDIDGVGHE